jgi:hypothetical protein
MNNPHDRCPNCGIINTTTNKLWSDDIHMHDFIYSTVCKCDYCKCNMRYYRFTYDFHVIYVHHNDTKSAIINFGKLYDFYPDRVKQEFKSSISSIFSKLPEYARDQELELYLKLL